jgi:hypothetical protein
MLAEVLRQGAGEVEISFGALGLGKEMLKSLLDVLMTPGAKGLPVERTPEERVIALVGDDVVYQRRGLAAAIGLAADTQRMLTTVALAGAFPSRIIAPLGLGASALG